MRLFFHTHKEKINYLLAGIWNTIFGYLAFILLYRLFSEKMHYLILFIISNIASITNAYISYKIFVFKTKGKYLKEYMRFYFVYGFSIVVNLALLPLIVEFLRINPIIAQVPLIFLNVIISYLGHKKFSFS
ncbi:GtrA family protein [Candidatus Saganbacteria bacterium]|nr:GtrA family protein [Candidatus Saganbacteria bacterium]